MKGHSMLTRESRENKAPGRLRKGLMYSDGSELREDDASAVTAYFKLIGDTLARDKYEDFLKLMVDFEAERIDAEGVENQLKDLFHGHPQLIFGLNRFFPKDIDISLPAETEQPEQGKTKQQISKGHMPLKQEKGRKKTRRERSEQGNEGPQVADNRGERNLERVSLEQATSQQKPKRDKGKQVDESHQVAERAGYNTVERIPSKTQNGEKWQEVEVRMCQGRHPTMAVHTRPVDSFTTAEFLPTNQMPALLSKQIWEASVWADAAKNVHVNKGITFTPTKSLLQDMKMPSLIIDVHEKQRLFNQCVNQNELVEDPVLYEQKRKTMNPWTPEETKLFLEKFKVSRKKFSKIASFLENKTTGDCVEYYYRNKKSGDLEMVRRRQKLQQNRERAR